MINLLPPDTRADLRAARSNTVLRKYLLTSAAAFGAIAAIFGTAFYLSHIQFTDYEQQRTISEQRLSSLSPLREKVKQYNDNFARAQTIFGQETKLSTLIRNLSGALPPGAVLSNVSFNVESLTQPISVTAQLDSFQKAAVLKRNFEDSGLFQTVVLSQVTGSERTDEEQTDDQVEDVAMQYPFTAILEVSLSADAAQDANSEEANQ